MESLMMEQAAACVRAQSLRPKALVLLVAAALAGTYGLMGPKAAWADGGRGSTTLGAPAGGSGGVDGDLASATGQMGNPNPSASAGTTGGGGGVDLGTGNGAAGGARGFGGIGAGVGQIAPRAGANGTAGAVYTAPQTIAAPITGNAGSTTVDSNLTLYTAAGGGGGGVGVSTTADLIVQSNVTGGAGRSVLSAGNGGGGAGIFSSAQVTVTTAAFVTGGAGGGATSALTITGGGGGGGMGVLLAAGGGLDNAGRITGGKGGNATTSLVTGGGGGDGGAGVELTSVGTVVNTGAITGGVGGNAPVTGVSGRGGAGVLFYTGGSYASGGTLINAGTITGGVGGNNTAAGVAGSGGAGVQGGNVTVINTGTISGAFSGTGNTHLQAAAIAFTGGVNTLEIRSGSVLNGNVLAYSSADTLRLGGATDGSFDTSKLGAAASTAQYQGFGIYEKSGASTWTLTGTTTAATPWTLTSGTLSIADDASLGASSGSLTLNGGTLRNTAAVTASRAVVLGGAGATQRTDADYTSTGIISGAGGLTKTGAATLTLSGANTYTGGTTITAGTVAISANENLGAAQSSVVLNGGTLQTTAAMSISRDIVLGAAGGTLRTDADLSNGGEISGVGGLTKTGAGTLTLTGPITYLGTTTIQEGTLLSPAVNLGSNDIANNGTLAVQQDNAGQLDGAIDGTGNLVKLGAGRLNLTGGGDMSGTTYVQAGTLSINSSLANSTVEVDTGATLGGNGTVGATTVRGGGTIAPGNSIGTLHVNGNFVQEAGSTYVVELDGASSDQVVVNGTATVQTGAGLTAVKHGGNDGGGSLFKAGTRYTVLSTTGGLAGTYTLNQTPLTAFLGVTDSYDANNAYLTVVRTRDPADAATTPNQSATAGGSAGSVVSDVLLNSPNDADARAVLDQLSGAALASAKGAMVYDSRYSRDLAIDRLRNAFCTVGAEEARSDGTRAAAGNRAANGANSGASQPGSRGGGCGNGDAAGRVAWGQAWGGWGHTNGNGNASGIERDSAGFVVGMDVPVGSWRVGGLTGYSHGRYKVDEQNARTQSDDFHLGVYGGTQWGALVLRLGGVYTFHDVNSGRDVDVAGVGGRMDADYQGNTTQAFGELGYQFKAGPVALEPFVNLAYVNLHTNAFNERGGDAALSSRSSDTSTSFSTLGLRASSDLQLGKVDATVRGLVGWRRAYGDVTPKSRVSFNGGDTFTVSGVPIGKDAAVIGAGLDLHITPRVTAGVAFDGQFGSGASDRTVSGTLRVVF
ncbi:MULTISPECIES: autotransporter domain-containing protein [unclassified Achromobacter]|uniref:autotransporter outer membrane beta-barrel domain-containing protein n=1 Tax=unclassified Achromobacter TaxID=2626865 RepID=UPI000B51D706|nr:MULTISPECIES: autotransporter domain-containing protein [unclassified Achromobacter]OWT80159.1 hypothetical protein CEY05_01685 [Achromobacter sp. HZ34]OWT82042.1 hypothetical protein CEY04_01685 [Achromobacter sp. HZ28]